MVKRNYTRAEFMKLAKVKKVSLRTFRLLGKTREEILADPDGNSFEMRRISEGVFDNFRVITDVRTKDIRLDGRSWLDLPLASQMEFDGERLRVYEIGLDYLTEVERNTLVEWEQIASTPEHIRQADIDIMTDGGTTYWEKVSFFEKKGMLHLLGYEWVGGRKLDNNLFNAQKAACVRDTSVRGELKFEYDVKVEDHV